MRKILIVLGLIIAFPIAYIFVMKVFFSSPWASPRCDKIELASVESPDLRWKAKAIQFGCGDGFASADWVEVIVVKPGTWWPTERDEVLKVTSDWKDGAKLEWQSKDHLLISVPESMEIYKQRPVVGNVTSEIKIVPVDLAAREKYFCAPGLEYSYSCREAREKLQNQLKEPVTGR